MLSLQGKGVSGGVAIGRARFLRREDVIVPRKTVTNTSAELTRYDAAVHRTVAELEDLYEWAQREVGQNDAQIFSVHAMMAQDEDLMEYTRNLIRARHTNAEYAVVEASKYFSSMFAKMEDAYMRERAADVRDVSDRILRQLMRTTGGLSPESDQNRAEGGDEGDIICARDLSPSETLQLDRASVRGFVTVHGSYNSHTAILSRTMNLPAVVNVGDALENVREGERVALDADNGKVYIDPDVTTLRQIRLRLEQQAHVKELLEKYRGRESRTQDGYRVEICANIGNAADVGAAIRNDADGIGLFRSEFLYMGRNDFPSEEEQFETYRRVMQSMPGKRVVVRTLDIGADKQAAYFGLPHEENPALGCRAVRISLTRPETFRTQARALLRASQYGRLAVMFPMIISTDEVTRLRAMWESAAEELRVNGVAVSDRIEIGIMIETPAAALISDKLATMVDFFSIGTNDLTQYTLALDRQNAALDDFCDTHHEAILRLIAMTVENARRAGIWVGICGELGADLTLTETFLRMGIDELSVTPPAILPLREKICTMRMEAPHAGSTAQKG